MAVFDNIDRKTGDITHELLERLATGDEPTNGWKTYLHYLAVEVKRHRAMVSKFEEWARRLDDLGGITGCRAVAAGIRNTIKGIK
jgi:hypothetical protein